MCSSVVLEGSHDALQQRVATQIYESCRSGKLELQGFPNYAPVVQALREPQGSDLSEAAYKVCVVKAERLIVLKSLAQRWLDFEGTAENASEAIKTHNLHFNPDGDFMVDDARPSQVDLILYPRLGARSAPAEVAEPPIKKIKIETSETCVEADIASLKNPSHGRTLKSEIIGIHLD